jgi:pyridoxine/pyridoxamine 5'-phosphate oxidase
MQYSDTTALLSTVWQQLGRAVHDSKHPFRTPGLATVDSEGLPHVRKIVLRAADSEAGTLRFYSDSRTRKIESLAHTEELAWLFWDQRKKLQVRARGRGVLLAAAEADRLWTALAKPQRKDYAALSAPGTRTNAADTGLPADWETKPAEATEYARAYFRAVDCILTELDVLQLAREGHQRAHFFRAGPDQDWQGSWVIP